MRIAALEDAFDDALLEQPVQAPFGSQFGLETPEIAAIHI
jgi:hypothetical protein